MKQESAIVTEMNMSTRLERTSLRGMSVSSWAGEEPKRGDRSVDFTLNEAEQ